MAKSYTKEYIYESFYHLLSKKHYNDVTVGEICSKAGVSRMSFYRIFSSKEDLALKGLDMVVNVIKTNAESLEHKNGFTVAKSIFETIQKYSSVIRSFEHSTFEKNIIEYITTKLQSNIPNDYILKTSKYISIFYFSAFSSVIISWLREGAKETPDEMARLLVSLVNMNFFKDKNEVDAELKESNSSEN